MIQHSRYSLKSFNTFGIDVHANQYIACNNIDDLKGVINSGLLVARPFLILGGGSNILFTGDFNGVVIHPLIKGIDVVSENDTHVMVRAGAGEVWDDLVAWAVSKGYHGIENLSAIPGTVGAAPVQNIGAYGVELKDLFSSAEVLYLNDGRSRVLESNDCIFSYRDSIFKNILAGKVVITRVALRLSKQPIFNVEYQPLKSLIEPGESLNLDKVRNAIVSIRKSKLPDPGVFGNAGSFFKNPVISRKHYLNLLNKYPGIPFYAVDKEDLVKVPAGWLIENAGWKGKRLGKAGVHPNQALVLINLGGATGGDILNLATRIEGDVNEKFDIRLEREVVVV